MKFNVMRGKRTAGQSSQRETWDADDSRDRQACRVCHIDHTVAGAATASEEVAEAGSTEQTWAQRGPYQY